MLMLVLYTENMNMIVDCIVFTQMYVGITLVLIGLILICDYFDLFALL